MKKWFSRSLVIKIDSNAVEYRTSSATAVLAPTIEISPKNIVVSVGKAEKTSHENTLVDIFADTLSGLKTPATFSYFKYIRANVSGFLRPKVCLIVSKRLSELHGNFAFEYISLLLATTLECEVFLYSENLQSIGYFCNRVNGHRRGMDSQAMTEQQGKRVLTDFSRLLSDEMIRR